jgi:F-type H+-transporting ATPase subunit delta
VTLKAIARRYATALFDVARANKIEDRAGTDLAALAAVIAGHEELRKVLSSPAVPPARKRALMDALVKASGPVGDEVGRLVAMLGERDLLTLLPDVADAFHAQLLTARRTVRAEFVTATPISEASEQALGAALGRALEATVTVTSRQDPEILGGVIAKVGSVVYDGSVAGQLNRLRQRLVAEV